MAYGDSMGYAPFREAIAEYLGAVRAVRCEPSQILVTTGSQQGLQICAQVLLNPKDRIRMDHLSYLFSSIPAGGRGKSFTNLWRARHSLADTVENIRLVGQHKCAGIKAGQRGGCA